MFCLHWSECCSFCWRRWIREKDQVTTSIFALWKDFYSKIWFFGCFQAESTSVFTCYLSKKIHSRGTFVMSIHSVGIFFLPWYKCVAIQHNFLPKYQWIMSFCNNSYLLTSTVASAVVLCVLCGFHQPNCQKDPTTVCRFLCFSNPIKSYRFSGCMWCHQICSTQCQSNLEAAGKPPKLQLAVAMCPGYFETHFTAVFQNICTLNTWHNIKTSNCAASLHTFPITWSKN